MTELIAVILCILGAIIALWLIVYGIKKLGSHKWMTNEDYRQLNKKAKRVNLVHQEYRKNKQRPKNFWRQLTDPSDIPDPIRRVL